ncbi:LptF/LptG family permease [bacterium]|nr:LptF/LptG family permease [bacterium]
MDTLDRYLVKETLVYLVLILLGLATLFLGIDFLTNFWRSHEPLSVMLRLYLYRMPQAIQLFVPLSCLMATLLVLTSMSRQNETLALYTSGNSTLRILSTFVALIACVSTVCFIVLDSAVPLFNRKHVLLSQGKDPSSSENLVEFTRQNFWYRNGSMIYNVGSFIPEKNLLKDVKVYVFTSNYYLLERIVAAEAEFDGKDWDLRDGTVVTYPPDSQYPIAMGFKHKRHVIREKPKDFKVNKTSDEAMRLRDLREYIERNKDYGLDVTQQRVNYHERVALVFTPLILILLAFPFALNPLKTHSAARSVGYCFLLIFIYLLLSRLSVSVGKSAHIPPVVAGWAPNFIFLTVAGLRLLRI